MYYPTLIAVDNIPYSDRTEQCAEQNRPYTNQEGLVSEQSFRITPQRRLGPPSNLGYEQADLSTCDHGDTHEECGE